MRHHTPTFSVQSPSRTLLSVSLALALLLPGGASVQAVPAATPATVAPNPQLQQDIDRLEGLEGEVGSIAAQVSAVEASIKAITTRQTELTTQISALSEQSSVLLPQLRAASLEHQRRQKMLMEAIDTDYKTPTPNAFFLAVTAQSISETLNTTTYTEAYEDKISRIAESVAKARDALDDQKRTLDGQRSTLEMLLREQDQLKAGVDQQNAQLKELYANRTNEAAYLAARVTAAKAQQEALLEALRTGGSGAMWGTYTDGAAVKQGDVIGFEGSTGNSTGCHTHYSAIKEGKWLDAEPFINMSIFRRPDGKVTQPFGMTDYAKSGAYGGNIHNGIDIVQGCGKPVRAAADGVIIRDNRTDGSGFGHYIMIRHAGGLITLYGHMV